MAEVVARLRQSSSEATSELTELYLAVREIAASSGRLEAALREIAAEAAALAASPGPTAGRMKNLGTYAASVRTAAEGQTAALFELRRGLEGWGFRLP